MATSHVNDDFYQVLKRLDQIQNLQVTLDHVMERLDTIHNTQERQNMKQNSMDVKLLEIMKKLEVEKTFMRDQLKEAQDGILTRLHDLQSQKENDFQESPSGEPVPGHVLQQPTQSRIGWSDIINEFRDKFQMLSHKTDLMSSQITETTKTCQILFRSTSKIETRLEETLTGRDQERENVKISLDEIIHIPEVVRGQTRAELVWLSNQIDDKWIGVVDQQRKQVDLQEQQNKARIDLETKVDMLYNFTSDTESELEALKDIVTKNIHTSTEKDEINSKCISEVNKQLHSISNLVLERSDEINRELERGIETVIRVTDTAKDDLIKVLTNPDVTRISYWGKLQGEIEQIKTSITSLAENLDTVDTSMATVVRNINSVKTSLNDGHKTVKEDILSLKQGQDLVTTKIEQSTNEVKDNIYRSKREIFAVTEKEAQIVRDRIEGPLPSLGNYLFDFYVENFQSLVRSGKSVHSPPWHINEAKTSRGGLVRFLADGNIDVRFIFSRHPREVGLRPRPAQRLKVKATICDVCNKVLADIVVGEETGNTGETGVTNGDWGFSLGVTSCDDLIIKGYGEKEAYVQGAILIRYDVTVL